MTLQIKAAKLLQDLVRVREDYGLFVKKVFETVDPGTQYFHSWHIDLIAEYMEAIRAGEIQKLIVNMPPRELKSIAITVAFPAWLLGHDAASKILCASYASSLSTGHSVDCRRVIESDWYQQIFPDTRIAKDQNEKTKYATTEMGHRISTSVLGSTIGVGGDHLILDDPIDYDKAHSPTALKAANNWIDTTWSTRKNNPITAAEILVMQRLHIKDPTAHLLDSDDGHTWVHVKIQRETLVPVDIVFPRSKKVLHRPVGDLLNSERNGPKQVASMKARLGDYGFESQQQQEPSPLGGGRIKLEWILRQPLPASDEIIETVLSFDTAQKETELNDPSVGLVFQRAIHQVSERENIEQWHLVSIWRDRVRYPELKSQVINMAAAWSANTVLIEDKSSGISLLQELADETRVPIEGIIPKESKVMRMDAQASQLRAGVIALPEEEDSTEDIEYLVKQLKYFPMPASWDEIDAFSQFLWWLGNSGRICMWGSSDLTQTSVWSQDGGRFKRK